jgi:hypothetical protein
MKDINLKSRIMVAVALLLTACVGDLDVVPLNPNVITSASVYQTTDNYKKGLAKLYASFGVSGQRGPDGLPDIGGISEDFGNYFRQYWNAQQLSTDEAVIAWQDQTIRDFHYQTWTQSDVFIAALYSRIMYTISISNEFIRATADQTDAEIRRMHAEARFVRALAYYHAIDLFGNPPFVTEDDLPGAFFPQQISRADLFTYIESELVEIEADLGDPKFEYGRADKAAANMLLAKLYLNAEVYAGTAKYTEAIAALNKVIAGPYALAAEYLHNFVADNHTSPEIIFPLTFDIIETQTYGGMPYLIHASIGGTLGGQARSMFGVNGGWAGIRTTKALVEKFDDTSGDTDTRALFWSDGQELEIEDIGLYNDGWAVTKYRNRNLDGSLPSNSPSNLNDANFVNTDFPMFRLADAHLMFAEAVVRGGSGGTRAQALLYINALRERAYGDNSGNITDAEMTADFILDERSRELYFETHRRTDLIRYGKFTGSNYLWPWKGNVMEGTGTSPHRNLYPIPAADLGANPTLEQNDGY